MIEDSASLAHLSEAKSKVGPRRFVLSLLLTGMLARSSDHVRLGGPIEKPGLG